MHAVILFVFGLLWMPQDGALTLEQLVEKMEARVAPVRDLSFEVEAEMGGGMLGAMMQATARHEVASRRDGTLRVRFEVDVRKIMLGIGMGGIIPGPTEFVYGEDALYVRREGGGRRESKGLRAAAARFVGNAPLEGLGGMVGRSQNVLYAYHLSPRRALALDGDVCLVGRRRLAGEEVYLIVAQRSLESLASEDSPTTRLIPTAYVKKIYVGATDFLVRRIEVRFGGADALENMVYSLTVSERTEFDGVAFPTKVVEQIDSPEMVKVEGWIGFTHIAKGFRRGDPGELLEEDLYATAATEPLDQIDKALASKPGEPAFLFSKVIARAGVFASPLLAIMPCAKKVPDAATQTADLEKIVAKRWAPSPVRALMALYAQAGDVPKLVALVERVEKDGKRSPVLALEAAEALNTLGQFDRALALLELASSAPAVRVAEERLAAYIGKGDLKKAMEVFRGALTAHSTPVAWVEHLAELRDQFPKGIDVEKVVALLDEALATSPKEAVLYLARLRVRPDEGIVRTILERVEEPQVREAAMAVLYEKIKEAKPEEVEKLLTVLPDTVLSTNKGLALMVRGSALAKAGKKEEARVAFLEGLSSGGPVTADLVAQMDELKDDEVTERACLAYLKSANSEDLLNSFAQQSGPLHTLGRLYAKQKREREFYHLFKESRTIEQSQAFFWMAQVYPCFIKAVTTEAMKDRSELSGLKWLTRMIGGVYSAWTRQLGVDTVLLWEKAREWAPDDLEVLQGLAESYALSNGQKAIEVVSEYLKFLEMGKQPTKGGWTRDQATLAIAQAHHKFGKKEDAKAALAKALFAEMSGDDLEARESAAAELRRMGPKVAKIIRPGLDSGDEEVQARVMAMLTEWAEPR